MRRWKARLRASLLEHFPALAELTTGQPDELLATSVARARAAYRVET
jgi:hypothetical protein